VFLFHVNSSEFHAITLPHYTMHILMKECPPPTFGPITCVGSKFTQMSVMTLAFPLTTEHYHLYATQT